MNKKVVFLDIDGTLVNLRGEVPQSAQDAIRTAKKNGHEMVICSGRSLFQIPQKLLDLGISDIVGAAGAFIIINGKEIYHRFMEPDKRRLACDYLDERGVLYCIQGTDGVEVTPQCVDGIKERFKIFGTSTETQKQLLGSIHITDAPWENDLGEKFLFYDSPITVPEMHEDLLPYFDVIEMSVKGLGNTSGEIGINGITKATGMERYLKYKAMKREDSIAIGDGTNDFEMVEYAGVGVAMGNGFDELKARADMVTRSIDDDGIYYAFKELGLI